MVPMIFGSKLRNSWLGCALCNLFFLWGGSSNTFRSFNKNLLIWTPLRDDPKVQGHCCQPPRAKENKKIMNGQDEWSENLVSSYFSGCCTKRSWLLRLLGQRWSRNHSCFFSPFPDLFDTLCNLDLVTAASLLSSMVSFSSSSKVIFPIECLFFRTCVALLLMMNMIMDLTTYHHWSKVDFFLKRDVYVPFPGLCSKHLASK